MMGLKSARVVLERCTLRIFAPLLQTSQTRNSRDKTTGSVAETHNQVFQRFQCAAQKNTNIQDWMIQPKHDHRFILISINNDQYVHLILITELLDVPQKYFSVLYTNQTNTFSVFACKYKFFTSSLSHVFGTCT